MEIVPVPALKDNYVWVIPDYATKQAVIVDPGEAAPVIRYLQKNFPTVFGQDFFPKENKNRKIK